MVTRQLPEDEYSHYQQSLSLLQGMLDKKSPEYYKFTVCYYRLTDVISKSRLYGDNPQYKSERYEVIGQLNQLSLLTQNTPFLYKTLLKKPFE